MLGAGSFGTCLAQHLGGLGHHITLLCRTPERASVLQQSRENTRYLPGVKLHDTITPATEEALADKAFDGALVALPTQNIRPALNALLAGRKNIDLPIICASKGIENQSLELPSQIIAQATEGSADDVAILSGPSFASEVMRAKPTAVCVASKNKEVLDFWQQVFHCPHFRTYTSSDPIGVQIAGACKNVLAIAAGAAEGLGYGLNARAAIVTRGTMEICALGQKMGADPMTFLGLSGFGDIFLTCSSTESRNYRLGKKLAEAHANARAQNTDPKPIAEILSEIGSIAEGYYTTASARALMLKHGLKTSVHEAVYKTLHEGASLIDVVEDLMGGSAKSEDPRNYFSENQA